MASPECARTFDKTFAQQSLSHGDPTPRCRSAGSAQSPPAAAPIPGQSPEMISPHPPACKSADMPDRAPPAAPALVPQPRQCPLRVAHRRCRPGDYTHGLIHWRLDGPSLRQSLQSPDLFIRLRQKLLQPGVAIIKLRRQPPRCLFQVAQEALNLRRHLAHAQRIGHRPPPPASPAAPPPLTLPRNLALASCF